VDFEILGPVRDIELVARLRNGITRQAELHWYEAHGIGRKEFKIKKLLPTL